MTFIPSFHFKAASEKLKPEWCREVVAYYNQTGNLRNLLFGKDIDEIEGYAKGKYDLEPFKKMFKSERDRQRQGGAPRDPRYSKSSPNDAIQWDCVPLIPPKLNAAVSLVQKIPIEITASCQDALAQKKKKSDLEFLKNKASMEAELQPLYDSMNLGPVDMGATQYSSIPFTAMPLDLDINNDEEFTLFADMIYNLAPESSFETVLQAYYDAKKISQIKLLEIRDQYKYGVSCHTAYGDKVTDLPTAEYIFPGDMNTDHSDLPDFSDNVIRMRDMQITPLQLLKYFPDEITKDKLNEIVNGKKNGYCHCNEKGTWDAGTWGTNKMSLKFIEVKSVDYVPIGRKPKSNYLYLSNEETGEKIWGQNTYVFYWLNNTEWFFGIDRLGYAHRAPGSEAYSLFMTNIYKSQDRSAVELCIGENKKATMADIKLQQSIIMSSPNGKVVDMKFIRNAIKGLKAENTEYASADLLAMAIENNYHIIDTTGLEGRQADRSIPVQDLPGGLKEDILGYYRVNMEADRNINKYFGTNDQLMGQAATPEGLVGLQKLMVNAAANQLHYAHEAIMSQSQSLFNIWAWHVKQIIEKGGAGKQALINIIGNRKVNIIDGMEDVPLHQIGIKITLGQREEERAQLKFRVQDLRQRGILNAADEYLIMYILNPKDAAWVIAVKENKAIKRQEQMQADAQAAQQQISQQQSEAMLQNTQQQLDGKIQQVQVQGEVDAKLMQLANQLGMSIDQFKNYQKLLLQNARIDKQKEKSLATIQAQKAYEAQQPLI